MKNDIIITEELLEKSQKSMIGTEITYDECPFLGEELLEQMEMLK